MISISETTPAPRSITVQLLAGQVALLRLGAPTDQENLIGPGLLYDMGVCLSQIEEAIAARAVRAVVLCSGSPDSFLSGADLRRLRRLRSAAEATALSRCYQQVLARLQALPVPTVATIHGACLGPGLELALRCTARIATSSHKTVLGLPEVQLGLIPCGGATHLLPALCGLEVALDLLLSGRRLRPDAARRLGLIDDIADPRQLLQTAVHHALVLSVRFHPRPARSPSRLADRLALSRAESGAVARQRGLHLSPPRILRAVRLGLTHGPDRAEAEEALALGELLVSPQAAQLISAFFAETALRRQRATLSRGERLLDNQRMRAYGLRLRRAYLLAAAELLASGAAARRIDEALLCFGFATGPLSQIDEVGLAELALPPLAPLSADGRAGRRAGRGIYLYPKGGGAPQADDDTVHGLLGATPAQRRAAHELTVAELAARCVLPLCNEAIACLAEGAVASPLHADIWALAEAGFPRLRGGPLRYADSLGAPELLRRMEALARQAALSPAPLLRQMAEAGLRFYPT